MLYADVLITPALTFLGKHQIYKLLGHYIARHGITVSSHGQLLVAQYPTPAVHIYNMQGDYLATISRTLLGLDEKLVIWGIRCASDGLLHLATGVRYKIEGKTHGMIQSLHAYRVGELDVKHRHYIVMTVNVNHIYDISILYLVNIKECIYLLSPSQ